MISFVVNILFALFLGINVWGYVTLQDSLDSAVGSDSGLECSQDCIRGLSDGVPMDSPLGAIIHFQGSSQSLLSRPGGDGLFELLDGRLTGPWSGILHGSVPVAAFSRLRMRALSPSVCTYPKDYFVYTLGRMLC